MPGQLMTPDEVARYLGVSVEWVKQSLRDRTIPGRKVRGRWVVSRPELDAWLAPQHGPATGPARRVRPKGSRP